MLTVHSRASLLFEAAAGYHRVSVVWLVYHLSTPHILMPGSTVKNRLNAVEEQQFRAFYKSHKIQLIATR